MIPMCSRSIFSPIAIKIKPPNDATLNTGSNGEVWVAVGITGLWETEMTYNLDDIKITIS